MRAYTVVLFVAMFLLVSHLQGGLQAYLDPGTGSIALQLLMAGFVGALAIGRLYWQKLRALLGRRNESDKMKLPD